MYLISINTYLMSNYTVTNLKIKYSITPYFCQQFLIFYLIFIIVDKKR